MASAPYTSAFFPFMHPSLSWVGFAHYTPHVITSYTLLTCSSTFDYTVRFCLLIDIKENSLQSGNKLKLIGNKEENSFLPYNVSIFKIN